MKHDLLKNIIKANSELIKNHNKNFIINPICYYWVIEYIAQESGNSFADIVEAFKELDEAIYLITAYKKSRKFAIAKRERK